jgi:hypothetical protein
MTRDQLVDLAGELAAVRLSIKALKAKESAIKTELNSFLDSKHLDSFGVPGCTISRTWQERVTLDSEMISLFLGDQVKDFQSVTKFSTLKVGV